MKDAVLNTYGFNLNYAKGLMTEIPEARRCEQPQPDMNHPAWLIGHLANTCDFMGSQLGLEPVCPPDWQDRFGQGSAPSADPATNPGKAELLEVLEQGHEHVAVAFAAAPDSVLAGPLEDEGLKKLFPTVGDLLVFGLTSHESTHLGQLSAWRRAVGMASLT